MRSVWAHEALSFTPWLATNLGLLSDAVGLGPLALIGTEQPAGAFSADILAETQTGEKVVIENQLAPSDHGHLGQCLTYAAGFGAKTIIWVVPQLRGEHRAALDWLNEHTEEAVRFFGVQLRVVKIGDSQPAVVFDVVARPNNWQKATRSRGNSGGSSGWAGWNRLYGNPCGHPSRALDDTTSPRRGDRDYRSLGRASPLQPVGNPEPSSDARTNRITLEMVPMARPTRQP